MFDLLPYLALILQSIQIAQNQLRGEDNFKLDSNTKSILDDLSEDLSQLKPNDPMALIEERLTEKFPAEQAKEAVAKLSMIRLIAQTPPVGMWEYWKYLEVRVTAFHAFCRGQKVTELLGTRYARAGRLYYRLDLPKTNQAFRTIANLQVWYGADYKETVESQLSFTTEDAVPNELPIDFQVLRVIGNEGIAFRRGILDSEIQVYHRQKANQMVKLTPGTLMSVETSLREDVSLYSRQLDTEERAFKEFLDNFSSPWSPHSDS